MLYTGLEHFYVFLYFLGSFSIVAELWLMDWIHKGVSKYLLSEELLDHVVDIVVNISESAKWKTFNKSSRFLVKVRM